MNILPLRPISFGSKNQKLKEADDLQRKAKLAFPQISSTYITNNYCCLSNPKHSTRAKEIRGDISDKIRHSRRATSAFAIGYDDRKTDRILYLYKILDTLKETKVGNCAEASDVVLASLIANGFKNAERLKLTYRVKINNKADNSNVYSKTFDVDHAVVTDDVTKPEKERIILDPWLFFTDFYSSAIGRYKNMYSDSYLNQLKNTALIELKQLVEKNGNTFNPDNYKINCNFVLKVDEDKTIKASRQQSVQHALSLKYPELLVNPK